jgi:hypothetical protein
MLKLYVLIRDDMTAAQQAVQAGHAVAQFGLDHPKEFKAWQEDNNTLIYLSVRDTYAWEQTLADGGFKHSVFTETFGSPFPSMHEYGGKTAIAVAPNWTCQYLLFKNLPLALQPEKKRKHWWNR